MIAQLTVHKVRHLRRNHGFHNIRGDYEIFVKSQVIGGLELTGALSGPASFTTTPPHASENRGHRPRSVLAVHPIAAIDNAPRRHELPGCADPASVEMHRTVSKNSTRTANNRGIFRQSRRCSTLNAQWLERPKESQRWQSAERWPRQLPA